MAQTTCLPQSSSESSPPPVFRCSRSSSLRSVRWCRSRRSRARWLPRPRMGTCRCTSWSCLRSAAPDTWRRSWARRCTATCVWSGRGRGLVRSWSSARSWPGCRARWSAAAWRGCCRYLEVMSSYFCYTCCCYLSTIVTAC